VLDDLRALELRGTKDLADLISWCWDNAENTGDARYCGVARTLELILDRWDTKSGLHSSTVIEMNRILASHLNAILDAESPAAGAGEARWMREQIAHVLQQDDI
jgi:hypothetical protein